MSEPMKAEEEYRSGYDKGWLEGIRAIYDLMHFKGLPYQIAYDWCADHLDRLEQWCNGDCTIHEPPPELPPYRAGRDLGDRD